MLGSIKQKFAPNPLLARAWYITMTTTVHRVHTVNNKSGLNINKDCNLYLSGRFMAIHSLTEVTKQKGGL